MDQPYWFSFVQQQFNRKIVDFTEIQTRIVILEGEGADHNQGPNHEW